MSIGIIFLNFCFNGIAKKHREHWSDIEVILRSQEPLLEMYAHFLVRDRHLPLVELLRKEVLNNFETITGQK